MRNLITKTLGIVGITALSFLPMRYAQGQNAKLDSIKFCVYGNYKDSILETRYYNLPPKKIETMYKKNEKEYYEMISNKSNTLNNDKSLKNREEAINLFIYYKGFWASGGEYVYDGDLNLIRICSKINGPKFVN